MEPALGAGQRRACGRTIHVAALACGGVSLLFGEFAGVGIDAWVLRGLQAMVFARLAQLTKVPLTTSAVFALKEFWSPVVIALACVRIGVTWLAIGGHVASKGEHAVAITAGIRLFNALISIAVTEKMGWGYMRRVGNLHINRQAEPLPAPAAKEPALAEAVE